MNGLTTDGSWGVSARLLSRLAAALEKTTADSDPPPSSEPEDDDSEPRGLSLDLSEIRCTSER